MKTFKEILSEEEKEIKKEKECPEGQHWCPKELKCVPIGSGDGEGPRGKGVN